MDWGKLLGDVLGGVGGTAMLNRWMNIESETELRMAIHNDIRDMSPDTIKLLLRSIEDSIHSFTLMNRAHQRSQAVLVRDVLLDEANRR